ncbi:hypothetical protein [Microbispora amethystogenes]|uniref:Secreted protein n=1 Tax=Microbispora amethystogenes TaxID=1427754 RepID=A0ABQ4FAQ2_9ACTN|nr:hypothetical protein [Microbispora amethystogenes]GIH31885.1 hypothetical protein Mam01_20490 [Microbispora amethystogenes]
MNAPFKRALTICAAAVLVTAVTAAPAAALDANYTCTSGTRYLMSDLLGYYIFGSGCTGSGTGPYGTVTIPSGSYFCEHVGYFPEADFLSAQRC